MRAMGERTTRMLPLVVVAVALGACVDEDVVFDERPVFEQVAEEAGGFVGYADPSDDDKLTFCGACHGEPQAQWEGTAHADAWAGLQQSDHVQEFCEACHSVTSLGNVVAEPEPGVAVGGHAAMETGDGRYLDVQCESCHGPGLDHVLDPRTGNVPLAPVQVGEDLTFGCGECHQGTHHPFVEEWEESDHAAMTPFAATAGPGEVCASCHTGEGALLRLGVTADYLEKDALLASTSEYAQITCAVCHDPHDAQYEGQMRFPIVVDRAEDHLCAQCHDRGAQPDSVGRPVLAPHSPATGMLAGRAGWFPPGSGLEEGAVTGPHGAPNNERLCASCHVVAYSVVDEATNEEFFSAGHGFQAAPCVGPNGLPSGEEGCALTTTARSFEGCLGSGCHASEEDALASLEATAQEVVDLVLELRELLLEIDPNLADPGGPLNVLDGRFTVADGAFFNLNLAIHGSGSIANLSPASRRRGVASAVAHNPTLMVALLEASIAAVQDTYAPLVLEADAATASDTR